MPGQTGDLERSLLDSMEGDHRLASGAQAPPADNVLDFVQMTGLAAQRRSHPSHAAQSARATLQDAVLDPLVFFEQGVSDVDTSMDPSAPILPDLDDTPSADNTPTLHEEPELDSITGLMEIIAELRQRDASGDASDLEATNHGSVDVDYFIPEVPKGHESFDHQAAESDSKISDLLNIKSPVAPTRDDRVAIYELDRAELADAPHETTDAAAASPAELGEARALLNELEFSTQSDAAIQSTPQAQPQPTLGPDLTTQRVSPLPSAAHRRPRNKRRRKIGRWLLRAMMLLILLAIGAGVVQFFLHQAESPGAAYRAAGRLLENGRYAEASQAYQSFARRFPREIEASDAMFLAGYALQLTPPTPFGKSDADYSEALALLEHFTLENPSHPKVARAETLMGVLHYRMENHIEAIRTLRDTDRRLRDPGAYLTTLRTLGRSYAALSQIDNAHVAFMRAAALAGNFAADEDYVELGAMYETLAERSASQDARREYWQQALEQWDYALRVPGLLKSRRDDIRLMRDLVSNKLDLNASGATGEQERSPEL